jgi:hypothetical protein
VKRISVKLRHKTGYPIELHDRSLTAQSLVFEAHSPWGGFVWNHPTAVVTERGGRQRRTFVPDTTLHILIFLGLVGLISLFLAQVIARRLRR